MKMQNRSRGKVWMLILFLLILPALCFAAVFAVTYPASAGTGDVQTDTLAEPLNGIATAKMDIDTGDGNLTVDGLTGGEPLLAGGTLQYWENTGQPARTLTTLGDQAAFLLKAGEGGQPWLRLPWEACNGATDWHIHLNPDVLFDLSAHSDGGNVRLDLSGLALSGVRADTGGGNLEVDLPEAAASLDVTAKTGAGNVTVRVSERAATRIHASTGLGKVIVDPRFQQIDETTYQTPDFEGAEAKIEITAESGAGNVEISIR